VSAGDGSLTISPTTGTVVATVAANGVSYAKIQQVSASSLLGNPTGASANASEITLGSGLSFAGSVLNVSALANPMTTTGDVIYSADDAGTPARLGIGGPGQFLTVSGGIPAWSGSDLYWDGVTFHVVGGGTTQIVTFGNGSYYANFCDGFARNAAALSDGTRIVVLCDSSNAVNAENGYIQVVGTSGNTFKFQNASSAPGTTSPADTPTFSYGITGGNIYLQEPNAWVTVNVDGTDYRLPLYLP